MSKINQPSGQIKLTNVSIVRMKKGGKRFEIACYKNKVNEFRSGVETDLSEILQIEQIFSNVTKGQVAKREEWEKAFDVGKGEDALGRAVKEILMKGDIQINEAERNAQLSSLTREIATIITTLTIDPSSVGSGSVATPPGSAAMTPTSTVISAPSASITGASSLSSLSGGAGPSKSTAHARPHTVGIIEKAMIELGFSPRTDRSAKAQALELIKRMEAGEGSVHVKRVRMRVRVTLPTADAGKVLKSSVVGSKAKGAAADGGAEHDGKGGKKGAGKGGKGNKKGKRRGDDSEDELEDDMDRMGLEDEKKETLKDRVKGLAEEVETEETTSAEWESVMQIPPSAFRALTELVAQETKSRGRVESVGNV